jgi:GT2 family glycosyltransferase
VNLRLYLTRALRQPGGILALFRRGVDLARRGELRSALQRASPRGFTDEEYQRWCARQAPALPASRLARPWLLLVDAPGRAVAPTDPSVRAFARILHRDGRAWRDAADPGRSGTDLATWVEATPDAWLVWLSTAATLEATAVQAFDAAVTAWPSAKLVYCDDDLLTRNGRTAPRFKPAWDRELLSQVNYIGEVLAFPAALADRIPANPAADAADDFLRAVTGPLQDSAIAHLPRVLVHRLAPASSAPPAPPPPPAPPVPPGTLVSVVVPTRDRDDLLRRCLEALPGDGTIPLEVIVVDNDSRSPGTLEYLSSLAATVVRVPGPFNFPRLVNAGAARAQGQVLLLLNNDAVLRGTQTLAELVSLALRPHTGAVGPLLVYEDGRIQSAGVFLGVNRTASNVLAGYATEHPVALSWCAARRQVSAVNGACLVVERSKFEAVGGFDETFAVSHNEIDFCLRLAQRGWSSLHSPFARVVHTEGATRGYEIGGHDRRRLAAEEQAFAMRWGPLLAASDPAHNPNLATRGDAFRLAPAPLAWGARLAGPFRYPEEGRAPDGKAGPAL